jgi:hypothetical protein
LAFSCEKQSIEDTAFNLFYLMTEVNKHRSRHFLRFIHSKFSIFIRSTSKNVAFSVNESTMHGSTRKLCNFPLHIDSSGKRLGFELSDSQWSIVSKTPSIEFLIA